MTAPIPVNFPKLSPEMDPWRDFTVEIEKIGHKRTSTELADTCMKLFRSTGRFIDDLEKYSQNRGYNFGYVWTRVRAFLPLQLRLVAEQIFWDRGGGWRRYISGFSPIKGGDGFGASVRVKPTTPPSAKTPIERGVSATGVEYSVARKRLARQRDREYRESY